MFLEQCSDVKFSTACVALEGLGLPLVGMPHSDQASPLTIVELSRHLVAPHLPQTKRNLVR